MTGPAFNLQLSSEPRPRPSNSHVSHPPRSRAPSPHPDDVGHHLMDNSPGSARTGHGRGPATNPQTEDTFSILHERPTNSQPRATSSLQPRPTSSSQLRHHHPRSRDQLSRRGSFSFQQTPNVGQSIRPRSSPTSSRSAGHRVNEHHRRKAPKPPIQPAQESVPAPSHRTYSQAQLNDEQNQHQHEEMAENPPTEHSHPPEDEQVEGEEGREETEASSEDDEEDPFQGGRESDDKTDSEEDKESVDLPAFPFKNVESKIGSLKSSSNLIPDIHGAFRDFKRHEGSLRQQLANERDRMASVSVNLSLAKQNLKDLEQQKSALKHSLEMKIELIETVQAKNALLQDTLSAAKEKHKQESMEKEKKVKDLSSKLEDMTKLDKEKAQAMRSGQSELESMKNALSTVKEEQKYSKERFDEREKEWDKSFRYQKKEKELSQTKNSDLEISIKKIQLENEKLCDKQKIMAAELHSYKEKVEQLQKSNFSLEFKNCEVEKDKAAVEKEKEAVELKLKETVEREMVTLKAVKSTLQMLSDNYLTQVECGKAEQQELGDLVNDAMVLGLLKGVESSACEVEAKSLRAMLEDGLTPMNAQSILLKGSMWMGAVINNHVSHKRDIKDFILALNGALNAYANLICDVHRIDYNGRMQAGARHMLGSQRASTQLMMVSRIMDNVVETCQLVESNRTVHQHENSNSTVIRNNMSIQNACEGFGSSGGVLTKPEPEHINQHRHQRQHQHHTQHLDQPQVKHESSADDEEPLDDLNGTEFNLESEVKGDAQAERSIDAGDEVEPGNRRRSQRKYNLRDKNDQVKQRRGKAGNTATQIDERIEVPDSGSASEASSAPDIAAPLRKKMKKSIITGK